MWNGTRYPRLCFYAILKYGLKHILPLFLPCWPGLGGRGRSFKCKTKCWICGSVECCSAGWSGRAAPFGILITVPHLWVDIHQDVIALGVSRFLNYLRTPKVFCSSSHSVYLVTLGVQFLRVFFYQQRYVLWNSKVESSGKIIKFLPFYNYLKGKQRRGKEKEWLNSDMRVIIITIFNPNCNVGDQCSGDILLLEVYPLHSNK